MGSYRAYFRNFFGVVGRDEFEAPDDASAYAVAESLCDALSDFCGSFELWSGTRLIDKGPRISPSEAIRLETQAIVMAREEAIQASRSTIGRSKRLLERLAEFKNAVDPTQRPS